MLEREGMVPKQGLRWKYGDNVHKKKKEDIIYIQYIKWLTVYPTVTV